MLKFLNIASGSKGNATLIYDESTLFMIDMGVSLKNLLEGLDKINRHIEDIEGTFITHEHIDHIKGVDFLFSRNIPVFTSKHTPLDESEHFDVGEEFHLGDFYIKSFHSSHDAADPVGYIIRHKDESLLYLTDTGEISETNLLLMKDCTYYIIESNHDLMMLMKSSRPMALKERIHSDHGHLSNSESVHCLASVIGENTKAIYLAHISEECNTPSLAINTYRQYLSETGVDLSKLQILALKQHEMTFGGDDED